MAVTVHENEGEWPDVAPHCLYLSPPDEVLAEQLRGTRQPGVVSNYEYESAQAWMAISAPPSDFWDQIGTPDRKKSRPTWTGTSAGFGAHSETSSCPARSAASSTRGIPAERIPSRSSSGGGLLGPLAAG